MESAWQTPSAAASRYGVRTGIWTNWSRGRIMGATLTLSRSDANLLIAFTAVFVGFVATRFWRLACLALHRHYSAADEESRDAAAVHQQRQVILRNAASAESGLGKFLELWWTWGRRVGYSGVVHRAALPSAVFALLCSAAFLAASGFSSRISSAVGDEVLVDGAGCGVLWLDLEFSSGFDAQIARQTQVTVDSDNANNYATQCYSSSSSSSSSAAAKGEGILDCASFVVKTLPGSVDRRAPCPFRNGVCRSDASNILLDTGYVDSNDHLGVNAPPEQRIRMRNTLHCAPLKTQGRSSNFSILGQNYTKYDYGPYLSGPGDNVTLLDHTFQFKSLDTQYPDEKAIAVANAATGLNFRLVPVLSLTENHKNLPLGDFLANDDLFRPDGDVYILFLSGNGVGFLESTTDDWYQATNPWPAVRIGLTVANGSGVLYRPNEAASPLGCVDRWQFCNPALSALPNDEDGDGGQRCTPLYSFSDAVTAALPLFNGDPPQQNADGDGATTSGSEGGEGGGDDKKEKVTGSTRFDWFIRIANNAVRGTGIPMNLGAKMLASQHRLQSGIQEPIPADQWQLDVTRWWASVCASMQQVFLDAAYGPADPGLERYKSPPATAEQRDMCSNQKIRSTSHGSFSLFALFFTFTAGSLIVAVSLATNSVLLWLYSRKGYKRYAYSEWVSNDALQLHRLAHERVGSCCSSETRWSNCLGAVPVVARPEEPLVGLDIESERDHPRLLAVAVPPVCSSPPPAADKVADGKQRQGGGYTKEVCDDNNTNDNDNNDTGIIRKEEESVSAFVGRRPGPRE